MYGNGPTIYATNDTTTAIPDDAAIAIAALPGVCYDEQQAVGIIEALVQVTTDADVTGIVISLWEGPALTGTIRQVWTFAPATDALPAALGCPIRYLDAKSGAAGVQYSLSVVMSDAGGASSVTVYGFTATVFPGGIVPLASND